MAIFTESHLPVVREIKSIHITGEVKTLIDVESSAAVGVDEHLRVIVCLYDVANRTFHQSKPRGPQQVGRHANVVHRQKCFIPRMILVLPVIKTYSYDVFFY